MRLGVGFIGSGFNAQVHMRGWQGVRDADVLGVWSPNAKNAASTAKLARDLGLGDCTAYKSITDMVADPRIHALWLCGPNHARIENVEEICSAIRRKKGKLIGIACEKPLARNVAEANRRDSGFATKHTFDLVRISASIAISLNSTVIPWRWFKWDPGPVRSAAWRWSRRRSRPEILKIPNWRICRGGSGSVSS